MEKTYAFIDEYGNHDLETGKDGASGYFIVAAIIINETHFKGTEEAAEIIRRSNFQTGEMKSSGVGRNHTRRVSVLKKLQSLDFKFYFLVVDKERIYKDSGYQYKKTFIKNINGKIYNKLFSTFSDIHIIADEHGNDNFKTSFRQYIDKNHKPDLFYRSKFDLVKSHDNVMVQVAVFIVGSVAKVYEKKGSPELKEEYLELLKNKCIGLDEWPTRFQSYYEPDITSDSFNNLILEHSLSSAEIFIENNESQNDEDIKLQVAVARFLVFSNRWIDNTVFIATKKINDHLFDLGFGDVNELRLRSKVIAKLRDNNVIIASSNKGYKIPSSFEDMEIFVETVNSKIKPLLQRLGKARSNLYLASKGEVDILKGEKYPHLVEFMEALGEL
jgi:hypothetical protein